MSRNAPFRARASFFENAGGALTLNRWSRPRRPLPRFPTTRAAPTSAAEALMSVIADAKDAARVFLNAPEGQIIVGESGTELLFRLSAPRSPGRGGGVVLGSTVESSGDTLGLRPLGGQAALDHRLIPHDVRTAGWSRSRPMPACRHPGCERGRPSCTPSPVTAWAWTLAKIAAAIRATAPPDALDHRRRDPACLPRVHRHRRRRRRRLRDLALTRGFRAMAMGWPGSATG